MLLMSEWKVLVFAPDGLDDGGLDAVGEALGELDIQGRVEALVRTLVGSREALAGCKVVVRDDS
jgi:hypothetical protein